MLWILETTALKKKKKYKHASLIQEKHKEKEKGNKKQPLA